jgi:hypothetical protein
MMPKDDIEQDYDAALGYCLDAMYSLRRFSGTEAIDSLKGAIRAIERGQRAAEQRRRRDMARPVAAYVAEPPASPDF